MKKQDKSRYEVEQHLLPQELYTSGPRLLSRLLHDANGVMHDLYAAAGISDLDYVFRETYKVCTKDFGSVLIVRIEMPEPQDCGLCRAVYLCYCDRDGDNLYFTSELANNGKYALYCRQETGRQLCSAEAPDDLAEELDLVAAEYWDISVKDCCQK